MSAHNPPTGGTRRVLLSPNPSSPRTTTSATMSSTTASAPAQPVLPTAIGAVQQPAMHPDTLRTVRLARIHTVESGEQHATLRGVSRADIAASSRHLPARFLHVATAPSTLNSAATRMPPQAVSTSRAKHDMAAVASIMSSVASYDATADIPASPIVVGPTPSAGVSTEPPVTSTIINSSSSSSSTTADSVATSLSSTAAQPVTAGQQYPSAFTASS